MLPLNVISFHCRDEEDDVDYHSEVSEMDYDSSFENDEDARCIFPATWVVDPTANVAVVGGSESSESSSNNKDQAPRAPRRALSSPSLCPNKDILEDDDETWSCSSDYEDDEDEPLVIIRDESPKLPSRSRPSPSSQHGQRKRQLSSTSQDVPPCMPVRKFWQGEQQEQQSSNMALVHVLVQQQQAPPQAQGTTSRIQRKEHIASVLDDVIDILNDVDFS